jgi:hypothetical protein
MQELLNKERYFFSRHSVDRIADLLQRFDRPCVLCAPTVGAELESRGVDAVTLDVDERFQSLRGFRRWDLRRPQWIASRFGVIFCDPPFFNVTLNRLFRALGVLAQFDFSRPLAVSYPTRRREALLSTFAPFGLRETDIELDYPGVDKCEKNEIRLFTNFKLRSHPA